MQATPPGARSSARSRQSGLLRLEPGRKEGGAANEPPTMSVDGGYNFRRVAIRRKSNFSYLPPGTPRPWTRPPSHLGPAQMGIFRRHASANATVDPVQAYTEDFIHLTKETSMASQAYRSRSPSSKDLFLPETPPI
ncbi:hypothetical protein GHT09_003965 [Marmota monax]|uniref:Uncharacterized protein n=1 Tax=Marmota monax TaxID=9995 RepID=A0A834V773_MARMO|nr:hypothetical protein GHT09_003965 [Marmota monax]